MKKVPELRFKGFNGEWVTEKIIELSTVTTGVTPLRSKEEFFKNGKTPWVKTLDLNNAFVRKTEEKITVEALTQTTLRLLPENTLLIAMYGGFNQIGRTGVIGFEGTTNQAIAALIPDEDRFNPVFLQTYLNHNVKKWRRFAASSRKDPNITKSDVENFLVTLPSVEEQNKIASFFMSLDQKIEKQQEKIEQLEELKKGMMQKIFSREIRFKDENGGDFPEWGKKKISEIGTVNTGNTPSKSVKDYWHEGIVPWITPTDINRNKNISNSFAKLTDAGYHKSRKIPANSILVTCIASIGKNAILKVDGSCNQQINAITPNNNYNVDFIYYLIESNMERIKVMASSTATAIINKNTFENIKLLTPILEEQKKIAEFLSVIDQKLDYEIEKLEEISEYKKGFMQRMFV